MTAVNGFDLDEWNSIGKRLVRRGAVSERQLQKALAEQKRMGGGQGRNPMLGAILVQLKYVDQPTLDEELAEQEARRPQKHASHSALDALDAAATKALGSVDTLTMSIADLKAADGG